MEKKVETTRRMYLPISEVKGCEPKWGFIFRKNLFDQLLNEKFGSKKLVVMCEVEFNPDGSQKNVKPLYDLVVEEDGPIDPETGLVKSPGAIIGLVVRREDGYYILVQNETRPIIRNHHTGKCGQTGDPVVIEHTLPGGFGDWSDKSSFETAMRELGEETGIKFDLTNLPKKQLVGCFSCNRAYVASCIDVYITVVSELLKAIDGTEEKDNEQIGKHKLVRIDKFEPAEDGVNNSAALMILKELGCIKNF